MTTTRPLNYNVYNSITTIVIRSVSALALLSIVILFCGNMVIVYENVPQWYDCMSE